MVVFFNVTSKLKGVCSIEHINIYHEQIDRYDYRGVPEIFSDLLHCLITDRRSIKKFLDYKFVGLTI